MDLFGRKKKAEEEDALAAISKQLEKFSSENREQIKKLEERVKKQQEDIQKLATKREVSKMGEGFARTEDIANARKGLATTEDVANACKGLASESYVDEAKQGLQARISGLGGQINELEKKYNNLICKRIGCTLADDLETAKTTIADMKKAFNEAAGKLQELDVETLKKTVYEAAFSHLKEKLDEYRAKYEAGLSEYLKNAPGNLASIMIQQVKDQVAEHVEQLKGELQITGDDVDAKCQGVIEMLDMARHKFYFYSLSNHHQNLLVRLVSSYTNAQGVENALSNPKNRNFDNNDWDQLLRMMDSAKKNQDITVEFLYQAVQDIRAAKSNLKPS